MIHCTVLSNPGSTQARADSDSQAKYIPCGFIDFYRNNVFVSAFSFMSDLLGDYTRLHKTKAHNGHGLPQSSNTLNIRTLSDRELPVRSDCQQAHAGWHLHASVPAIGTIRCEH